MKRKREIKKEEESKTCWIYVLALSHGCYYVGKTTNIQARLKTHQFGKGSKWTGLHPPVRIVHKHIMLSPFEEDRTTLEWMIKIPNGIEKVRGGTYSKPRIPSRQKRELLNQLRGGANCCYNCGLVGHFAAACPSPKLKNDQEEDEEDEGDAS